MADTPIQLTEITASKRRFSTDSGNSNSSALSDANSNSINDYVYSSTAKIKNTIREKKRLLPDNLKLTAYTFLEKRRHAYACNKASGIQHIQNNYAKYNNLTILPEADLKNLICCLIDPDKDGEHIVQLIFDTIYEYGCCGLLTTTTAKNNISTIQKILIRADGDTLDLSSANEFARDFIENELHVTTSECIRIDVKY